MSDPDALTTERGETHGEWGEQAHLAYALRHTLRSSRNWNDLDPAYSEALEMIAVKISRILTGVPGFKDHWDDIAGYAYLASKYDT